MELNLKALQVAMLVSALVGCGVDVQSTRSTSKVTPDAEVALTAEALVDQLAKLAVDAAEQVRRGASAQEVNQRLAQQLDDLARPHAAEAAKIVGESLLKTAQLWRAAAAPNAAPSVLRHAAFISKNTEAQFLRLMLRVDVIREFASKCNPAFLSTLAQAANRTTLARKTAVIADEAIHAFRQRAQAQFDDAFRLAAGALHYRVGTVGGHAVTTLVEQGSRPSTLRGVGLAVRDGSGWLLKKGVVAVGTLGVGMVIDTLLSGESLASGSEIIFDPDAPNVNFLQANPLMCLDRFANAMSVVTSHYANLSLYDQAAASLADCYEPRLPLATMDDYMDLGKNQASAKQMCSDRAVANVRDQLETYLGAAEHFRELALSWSYDGCLTPVIRNLDVSAPSSDLNDDGVIDAADASIAFDGSSAGDLDDDGVVDAKDFGILFASFGKSNWMAAAVTEPSEVVSADELDALAVALLDRTRWAGCEGAESVCFPGATWDGIGFYDYVNEQVASDFVPED